MSQMFEPLMGIPGVDINVFAGERNKNNRDLLRESVEKGRDIFRCGKKRSENL